MSRTIKVLLIPDKHGIVKESDWRRIDEPTLELGRRLAMWADSVRQQVADSFPAMPDGVVGRYREVWQPLMQVAEAAGGRWPDVVSELSREHVAQRQQDVEDGLIYEPPAVILMKDAKSVWPRGVDFVQSSELAHLLAVHNPGMWGSRSDYGKALTPKRLATMLNESFSVRVGRIYKDGETLRGFSQSSFEYPWRQFAPDEVSEPSDEAEANAPDETDTSDSSESKPHDAW